MMENGTKFQNQKLVKDAVEKGLDYVQLALHSHDPAVHNRIVGRNTYDQTVKAIKNVEKEDLFFMITITLTPDNIEEIEKTIRFIHDLKVKVFACNGLINTSKTKYIHGVPEDQFYATVENIEMLADELEMQFIWYTPSMYGTSTFVDEDFSDTQTSAANSSITIEPNGDVLACQTIFEPVGNILKDDWKSIWHSPLFEKIRKNEFVPKEISEKDLLTICGGGNPLYS